MSLPPGCERECPGCTHREYTETESISQKSQYASDTLSGLTPSILVESPKERWGYRSRVTLRATYSKDCGWKFGLRKLLRREGFKKIFQVIPIPECPVHHPEIREILRWLPSKIPSDLPLAALHFEEKRSKGWQVTMILSTQATADPTLWKRKLMGLVEEVEGRGIALFLHFYPQAASRLWGRRGGFALTPDAVAPSSFRQLIPELSERAYCEMEKWLGHRPVLDLYCGDGSGMLSRTRAQGLGVELVRGDLNPRILQGRVEDRIPQINEWMGGFSENVGVIVNPPRAGLSEQVRSWIGSHERMDRVAYLSCEPKSLAKDLQEWKSLGLVVHDVRGYDFFPQTRHVEVLALLSRSPRSLSVRDPVDAR